MKYLLLGKSGLRVSELCLGTMTFGTEWGWGADKDESRRIFNYFADQGGNFIDTANRYTEGTSEIFLGDFIKERGNRDEVVLATKYSLFTRPGRINDGGNHRKNMVQSVEGSLKRLGMDYIDVLYLHAWDGMTPVEEVMRGLDDLVRSGKVLYIGISDTPAWQISRANMLAELRGWSPFIAMQAEFSLLQRETERDLIPMAAELNIGVTAWAPLAGGALTGKYLSDAVDSKRVPEGSKRRNDRSISITKEVVRIAQELNCTPAQVALQWTRRAQGQIIPVVGATKLSQIEDSVGSTQVVLSDEHLAVLNAVSAIEMGFPHDFLASPTVDNVLYNGFRNRIVK